MIFIFKILLVVEFGESFTSGEGISLFESSCCSVEGISSQEACLYQSLSLLGHSGEYRNIGTSGLQGLRKD
jgi:hypothetical protein